MVRCHLLRVNVLLLVGFLFISTSITWLRADSNTRLECLNNFLYSVNCSLKIKSENTPVSKISYQLSFTETLDEISYKCVLFNIKDDYFCSISTSIPTSDGYDSETFSDTNIYAISLCHHKDDGSETCDLLDDDYLPHKHVKPNPPCCVTVSPNASHHHFTWKSTYERYRGVTTLEDHLEYQLYFYRTQDKAGVVTQNFMKGKNCLVESDIFLPNTEYAAKVRSSPFNSHFVGQWSDWSSEVLWTTEPAKGSSPNTLSFELRVVFVAVGSSVILVSLLCYVSLKKWRRDIFIPTPAPYFHTLYTDYKGDFKSWIVTQNTEDMLTAEETLTIDTLIKCIQIQEDERPPNCHQHETGAYINVPLPQSGSNNLGMSNTECSTDNLPVFSQSGSSELDSGCCLCSNTSLEKEPRWYCNEYCTLSCFQQSASMLAEHKRLTLTPCPASVEEI